MLLVEDIEELRKKVRRARQPLGEWFLYWDGPLFGIRVRLEDSVINHVHSWCQVTRFGPVVARYSANPALHRCFFEGLDAPGNHATPEP